MCPDLLFVDKGTNEGRADTGAGAAHATINYVAIVGFDLFKMRVVQRQAPHTFAGSFGSSRYLLDNFIVAAEYAGVFITQKQIRNLSGAELERSGPDSPDADKRSQS